MELTLHEKKEILTTQNDKNTLLSTRSDTLLSELARKAALDQAINKMLGLAPDAQFEIPLDLKIRK